MKPMTFLSTSRLLIISAGLAAMAFSTSCSLPQAQADPTRYFLLGARDLKPADVAAPKAEAKKLHLGLKSVEVPAYLKSRNLAVRVGASEVTYREFERWAEGLDQGVARCVRENLSTLPSVASVGMAPFRTDEERDFDISVRIVSAEGTEDKNIVFVAQWDVIRCGAGNETIARGRYEATGITWDGRSASQLASGLSDAVAALSREISVALSAK